MKKKLQSLSQMNLYLCLCRMSNDRFNWIYIKQTIKLMQFPTIATGFIIKMKRRLQFDILILLKIFVQKSCSKWIEYRAECMLKSKIIAITFTMASSIGLQAIDQRSWTGSTLHIAHIQYIKYLELEIQNSRISWNPNELKFFFLCVCCLLESIELECR